MASEAATVKISMAPPRSHAGGCTYNQDRGVLTEDAAARQIALFDGHGTYGEEMAQWMADLATRRADAPLPTLFAEMETEARGGLARLLTERGTPHRWSPETGAFYYEPGGDDIRGGTTASVIRIAADGSMEAAHVGDSEIRVFDNSVDEGFGLDADHTPTNIAEYHRIRDSCDPPARFEFDTGPHPYDPWMPRVAPRPMYICDTHPESGRAEWMLNPRGGYYHCDVRGGWGAYLRSWDGRTSLAMTRSIGDFHMKRFGVSALPSMVSVSAPRPPATAVSENPTIRAIVVATDGLWDAVHYHEVRDLVRRADLLGHAEAATAALLEFGMAMARARFGPRHDNITVSVSYISVFGIPVPPAA
jgi:serine/threonine protein phosphatase PrpC